MSKRFYPTKQQKAYSLGNGLSWVRRDIAKCSSYRPRIPARVEYDYDPAFPHKECYLVDGYAVVGSASNIQSRAMDILWRVITLHSGEWPERLDRLDCILLGLSLELALERSL